ncbi:hypothetical protein HYH03_009148 [Edaphochlamys debaryana]|uniref:protein disulfide-isomerase n=1 Tax=Edaphochlamys debaryana TaxID=47281 RepID=A0A835XYC2_9CHLO|nr:hypothetical protein HYH03_009148 [Edaphochlamys debaryana]|eukprot:KAG2492483.1 hypothetical protein HYH03_009148 [Edaphochlamys debaryana]
MLHPIGANNTKFYAPWCGHCQSLAPQYKKVASNLQGMALVGAVDCHDKANDRLCAKYGVRGFPTIKLFGPDKSKNPYTGELSKEAEDYNGPRTAKPLADAVTARLTDAAISRLASPADLEAFREKAGGRPQVLLFTTKAESTPLYKALSLQLRKGLAFGEVHSGKGAALVEEFGVGDMPALIVVKPDGSREPYAGELKAPALLRFLTALAAPAEGEGAGKGAGGGGAGGAEEEDGPKTPPPPAWAFVRQVDDLSELPGLEAREDMALLALHGPAEDGCKDSREAFLGAAGEMQALVDTLLVALPASALAPGSEGAGALARLGADVGALEREPCELQLILLPYGADKADLDDYRKYDGPPDGKSLQAWVGESLPPLATRLDDHSAGPFLATDPSEGRMVAAPKAVLFTNKDEAPGVFRALALALKGRGNMAFAWVQVGSPGSKATVESFKPQKVPSLLVILPQPAPDGNPAGMRFGLQPYFGPLRFSAMRGFLEEVARQVEQASGVVDDPELEAQRFPQITSQAEFEQHCTSPAGLCLLGLLEAEGESAAAERKSLASLAVKQAEDSAFHFAWVEARRFRSVMQAFGVLGSDLPTLVALSARRMRFAVMQAPESDRRGSARLSPEAVSLFVQGVLGGKVRTDALQALPEFREGDSLSGDAGAAGARGGSDAPGSPSSSSEPEPPVEEEFDLSDILAEEVEGGGVAGKADRLREVEEELEAEAAAAKAAASKKSSKKKKKKGKKAKKEEL